MPIVSTSSITHWMMLASFRMSKESLFRKCDVVRLRSIENEDSDDRVSNPTDLAIKFISICSISSQTSFSSVCAPRSEKTALCDPKILGCSVHGTIIDLHVAFSKGHDLEHADWFVSPVLTRPSKFAWEIRSIYAGCAALRMFLLRFIGSPSQSERRPADGQFKTHDFS